VNTEVVVVGAGVMGLATACELQRMGADVVVLEQFGVGTRRGSSHGASRVFRLSYDDPVYIGLAQRALEVWRECEARTGCALLETAGLVEPLREDGYLDLLDSLSVPYEVVAADDASTRWPGVRLPGDVVFQPDAAVISADETVSTMREHLADVIREAVRAVRIDGSQHSVTVTTDELEVSADVAVLCCGAYAPELLRDLGVAMPFVPTREQIAYFAPMSGSLEGVPIINDPGGASQVYGLPTHARGAYKLAEHGTGPAVDLRTDDLQPDAVVTERLCEHARTYLPGFDPEPVGVEVCIYENTPDRDFVIDRLNRVVVGAGFSGHGFKFAPLIGRILAELAVGREPDFPRGRFALDRPALQGDGFELGPAR
jgi:sarcosine oxidase